MARSCLGICFDNIKTHLYLNCRAQLSSTVLRVPEVETHETMLTSVHFVVDYIASAPSVGKIAVTLY